MGALRQSGKPSRRQSRRPFNRPRHFCTARIAVNTCAVAGGVNDDMSGFLPGSITHVLVRPSCLSGNEEFGIGKSKHIMLAICLCNYKVDGTRRPCSSACAREIIRLLINKRFLAFLRAQDTSARRFSARFSHGFEVFQKDVAVSVDALLVVLKSRNVMTQFIIKPFLQFSILFRKGRILMNKRRIAFNKRRILRNQSVVARMKFPTPAQRPAQPAPERLDILASKRSAEAFKHTEQENHNFHEDSSVEGLTGIEAIDSKACGNPHPTDTEGA